MMKTHLPFFFVLILFAGCGIIPRESSLSQWTLRQEGSDRQWDVSVPSTVAGALNEAGFFGPDVKQEGHYARIDKSPFDTPWVYTTTFEARKGMAHILQLDGINYRADIDLNGARIASADTTFGTFSVREIDITPYVRRNNTLTVTVFRPREGDLNAGYVDWNPRPVDESMGIIRPVRVISTPDVEIRDVFVRPFVNPDDLSRARARFHISLINRADHPVEGDLVGTYEGGSFRLPVKLGPGEAREETVEQTIDNPRIWWSREMGSPELYHLDVSFCKGKTPSHRRRVTFGLRDIRSEVDELGHRQFILNGRKVLVKAGGWTDDIFMEDTHEALRRQVEMVADMGLNCIRFENVWGKDDRIYDLCDSLGILSLVGFSCQWEWEEYCGIPVTRKYGCINTPETEALAVRYFHDQVVRLRNHPSLIGWMTGSDRIPNPRLEEQYLSLYDRLDYRPYVCSAKGLTSLAGPSGMKMEGPYEYVGPDYWWLDTRCGGAFGFNTETGPGLNLPQLESLRKTVGEADLWPIGPSWAFHCTASASHMNSTAFQEKVIAGVYGEATSLEDYVRKAHALDYDSERAMYEAFRGNLPRTTGIVQWMLNSAWPSLYWQLYDWWGIPTAGYYGTKAACRPVQLVYNYADACVYAVNDAVPEASVQAVMKVYGPDSRLVREETVRIVSREREPRKVFGPVQGPCFLSLALSGDVTASNFYCIPAGNNDYDWDKADWWGIPIREYASLSFVSDLPEANVRLEVHPVSGNEYDVVLTNDSPVIAYQNILKALSATGDLVPGTVWSENFISLCPGQRKTVRCTLPQDAPAVRITLSGWNVNLVEE